MTHGNAPAYYSAAYRLLERYAAVHSHSQRKGKPITPYWRYHVPDRQRDLITALNEGDEETIKAQMMAMRDALAGGYE